MGEPVYGIQAGGLTTATYWDPSGIIDAGDPPHAGATGKPSALQNGQGDRFISIPQGSALTFRQAPVSKL